MPVTRYYEFLGFRVDMLQRQVRDPKGRVVELPARAFDTLVHLLEHHGEDVGKGQLMQAVWPDTVVEENNLSQAIAALRRAFGDQRSAPRVLMTVPGRGYRFIAELSSAADHGLPGERLPAAWHRRRLAVLLATATATAALALAAVVGLRGLLPTEQPDAVISLAVLPFTPLMPEHSEPALELGMADTLIAHISTLPGVVVRPINAVRRFATIEQDPLAAGRELGVTVVLAGSVQTQGDRMRVVSHLLRVADGQTLWSERFDVRLNTIFDTQDAIAGAVMSTLAKQLGTASPQRPLPRATANTDAYRWYLTGVYNRQRHDLPAAAASFRKAVEEDPEYALAWSALSAMLAALGVFNVHPPDTVYPQAREAALRALELDPGLADAVAALGHVLVQYERRYAEGEAFYREARDLNPAEGLIRLWTSVNYLHLGREQEALEQAHIAQALEPGTLPFAAHVALVLYYMRAYEEAIVESQRILELQPRFDHARSVLGRALLAQGDHDAAVAHFNARHGPSPGSFGDLGRAYATMGQRSEAYAEIDELRRLGREGFGVAYDIAAVHALLGELSQACAALVEALDERSMGLGLLRLDPAFDPLREEPCVEQVTQRLMDG